MPYDAEILERAALEDLHRAATREIVERLGLRALTIGEAFVSVASSLPPSAIVVNRVLGMGLGAPATEASTREILAAYTDAGVTRFLVQRHPEAAPRSLVDWLLAAGLEKTRGWQKFRRGRVPAEDRSTVLEVREVGPDQGDAFGRIVSEAFDLGPASAPWLAALPGRPGWHIFMSFHRGRPAGAGALFVHEDRAWMDFGATAREFRRRGSQGAILARRIRRALELGCREMWTCTGEDVSGDPQHSYRNILRAGFRTDYLRENYAPPKP